MRGGGGAVAEDGIIHLRQVLAMAECIRLSCGNKAVLKKTVTAIPLSYA